MTTAAQALEARLSRAKEILRRDRQSLYESERQPPENTVDAEAAEWLAEYDDAIAAIESTAAELSALRASTASVQADQRAENDRLRGEVEAMRFGLASALVLVGRFADGFRPEWLEWIRKTAEGMPDGLSCEQAIAAALTQGGK